MEISTTIAGFPDYESHDSLPEIFSTSLSGRDSRMEAPLCWSSKRYNQLGTLSTFLLIEAHSTTLKHPASQ